MLLNSSNSAFYLEIEVLESERVMGHRIQGVWSPVWNFGVPGHLLVLVLVAPLYFIKSEVSAAISQDTLEHFMLQSADKLYVDAKFFHKNFDVEPGLLSRER